MSFKNLHLTSNDWVPQTAPGIKKKKFNKKTHSLNCIKHTDKTNKAGSFQQIKKYIRTCVVITVCQLGQMHTQALGYTNIVFLWFPFSSAIPRKRNFQWWHFFPTNNTRLAYIDKMLAATQNSLLFNFISALSTS